MVGKENLSLINMRTWWELGNSIYIWIVIGLLLGLLFNTSWDPATGQFTLFGENQVLILGFITVLLLFKYISKIKIGPVEIEFKIVENKLGNASEKLSGVNISTFSAEEVNTFTEATKEIDEARALVQLMRARYS